MKFKFLSLYLLSTISVYFFAMSSENQKKRTYADFLNSGLNDQQTTKKTAYNRTLPIYVNPNVTIEDVTNQEEETDTVKNSRTNTSFSNQSTEDHKHQRASKHQANDVKTNSDTKINNEKGSTETNFKEKMSDSHSKFNQNTYSTQRDIYYKNGYEERCLKVTYLNPGDIKFDLDKDYIGNNEKIKFVVNYIQNQHRFTSLRNSSKPFLLYGPPGTGKSTLVQAIAKTTGRSYVKCSASSFVTKYQGSGAESIRILFDEILKNPLYIKPMILFIDEADGSFSDRSLEQNRDTQNSLLALLEEIDNLANLSNNSINVFMATNIVDKLDSALRSRSFEIKMELPNAQEREKMLVTAWAKVMPTESLGGMLEYLVRDTEGFSGRDIIETLIEGALHSNSNYQDYRLHHFRPWLKSIAESNYKRQQELKKAQETKDFNYQNAKFQKERYERENSRLEDEEQARKENAQLRQNQLKRDKQAEEGFSRQQEIQRKQSEELDYNARRRRQIEKAEETERTAAIIRATVNFGRVINGQRPIPKEAYDNACVML